MPTTRTQIFPDSLQTFDQATAVIDQDGRAFSFGDLLERADRVADQLGQIPRLVFVEASNTVDALAAYVACLRGRHPVHLCMGKDAPHLEALIEAYRPNAVIRTNATRDRPQLGSSRYRSNFIPSSACCCPRRARRVRRSSSNCPAATFTRTRRRLPSTWRSTRQSAR